MLKAYKYRIYPTVPQQILMAKHFGCVRLIYNLGLEVRETAWKSGVSIGHFEIKKQLPELKTEFPFLKEVNSQSLQQSLKDLDIGYSRFFKKQSAFPRYKSKSDKQKFHCPQNATIFFSESKLFLPKFDAAIKIEVHREFRGMVRSCTISKEPSGKYFASLLVENNRELPKKKPIDANTAIGIDLGIKTFGVCSDDTTFDNPKYLIKSSDRLKFLQKKLSRCELKSKRRNRARIKVAKAHEKIRNQRKDFLHKVSDSITKKYDTICMENLKVSNMLKNHKLARSISDTGWGMFKTMVKYKCEFRGKNFLEIGTFEPSSKTCNDCGNVNNSLTLKDREWTCCGCGIVHDRDKNASKNIKDIALKNWRVERSLQDIDATPLPVKVGKRAKDVSKIRNIVFAIAS